MRSKTVRRGASTAPSEIVRVLLPNYSRPGKKAVFQQGSIGFF